MHGAIGSACEKVNGSVEKGGSLGGPGGQEGGHESERGIKWPWRCSRQQSLTLRQSYSLG